MAGVVTERDETAKPGNIDESLEHEREAQVETRQLLADLKDKEAIALEMIAILRGVRGPVARYDRKAARKALARVKQRCTVAEQSLRRSQNRLKAWSSSQAVSKNTSSASRCVTSKNEMMYSSRDEVIAGQQQFPWASSAGGR